MYKSVNIYSFILAFILFLPSDVFSQVNIEGEKFNFEAGQFPVLDELFTNYEIYRISSLSRSAIEAQTSAFRADLDLGERFFELNLYKDNLKLSYEANNKPQALGGSLNDGGIVSMTINDGFIFGFIKSGSSKYYIEPLNRLVKSADSDLFLFYNVHDVIHNDSHVCGADLVKNNMVPPDTNNYKLPTTMCKVVDYAIANTYDMVTALGSSTAVSNFNTAVLNDVQTNYRSEFDANLEYDVVATYIPASSAGDPYEPPTSSTNGSTLLSHFRDWARGPGNAGGGNTGGATGGFGVDYTMAGLWTDTDFSGGVVGIAYTPGWHHILENYTTSAASLQVMVSHEIGHNWDAVSSSGTGHDPTGSDFIMAPSVTLTDNWSAASKSDINARVASQTYLDNCSVLGTPNANFFQSSIAVCTNQDIEFEDQSQYGATRSWNFTNGTPANSTSEKPLVSWTMTGLHMAEIISTNGAGSDSLMGYVDIQSAPPTPCTPSGTGGSAGIGFFVLDDISNDTGTSTVYQNFACSQVATLDTNTAYVITFTAVSITDVRFFIDYNDDGDFTDAGESSPNYGLGNPNATYNLPAFTTPLNPTTGQLLRFRIIGSNTNISADGCHSPTLGEVEDYAIYFEEPQVFGCTDPAASNYDPNATVDDGSCTYGTQTWYEDLDSDTYGNPNVSQQSATQPPGYVLDNTDCNDNDALEFPGQVWYKDADGDTYSDGTTITQCTRPVDYYDTTELNGLTNDCDDNNANAYPGNIETCDGVDNDCDGTIDEGVQITYYQDFDGDGFGNPNVSVLDCTPPSGYVTNNLDCNDSDALEFPGQIWFKDFDGDLYGDGTSVIQCTRPMDYYVATELISVDLDCDDNNANAFPGNTETCDGIDNDCDGFIDEGLTSTFYLDFDNDGFGDPNNAVQDCQAPNGYVNNNTDCDDNDALEFPGQTWYKDSDGDSYGDGTTQVQCLRPAGYYAASELTETSSDCNDNDSAINPGASEICFDNIDNNCDGNVDEGCIVPPDCDGTNLVINDVTQTEYGAEINITSDAVVDLGTSVLFAAGEDIDLQAGFEVEAGTEFTAVILPCNTSFDEPGDLPEGKALDMNKVEEIKSQLLKKYGEAQSIQFKVYDRWGQEKYTEKTELQELGSNRLNTIDNNLEAGTYLVVLKIGDELRNFVFTVK